MKTRTLKLASLFGAAALAVSFSGPAAAAGSNNASFTVQTNVVANCTISVPTLDFGAYDPIGANAATALTASTAITLNCTKGTTTAVISLGNGNYSTGPSATTRRMSDGAATPTYLTYDLYLPSGTASGAACSYAAPSEWGSTAGTDTLAPTDAFTGAPQT